MSLLGQAKSGLDNLPKRRLDPTNPDSPPLISNLESPAYFELQRLQCMATLATAEEIGKLNEHLGHMSRIIERLDNRAMGASLGGSYMSSGYYFGNDPSGGSKNVNVNINDNIWRSLKKVITEAVSEAMSSFRKEDNE